MARCLSETLIREQNEEEAAIMRLADGMGEATQELVRKLYAPTKITNEDLSRIYTPDEIRHLCLHTKVRVNMNLFNCVWDAKRRLDKKNRLTNRSQRFVDAMLVKAVTKKMVTPYTSEEIAKSNYDKQCELKKENNRRLDVWHFECSQASILQGNSTDSFQPAQIPIENNNIPEVAAMAISFPVSIPTQTTPSLDNDSSEVEIWSADDSDSESSVNVASANPSDIDWAVGAIELNTESITIDSESLPQTESQPVDTEGGGISQPQLVSSENYHLFDTQVPATSTQTQCSQDFI